MQVKFDPVLHNVLNFPVRARATRQLGAKVQNDIILL